MEKYSRVFTLELGLLYLSKLNIHLERIFRIGGKLSFYTSTCYMNLIHFSKETKVEPKYLSKGFSG